MCKYFVLGLLALLGSLSFIEHGVQAKRFRRCELAKELRQRYSNLPQFSNTLLRSWICLIEHESEMDTGTKKRASPLSNSYGLFQIKSSRWCGETRNQGQCNKKCSDFLDDNLDDDVACAAKIFDTEGFQHWQGWRRYCKLPQNLPQLHILCPNSPFFERHTIRQYLIVPDIVRSDRVSSVK